jgi:hypothetical protein
VYVWAIVEHVHAAKKNPAAQSHLTTVELRLLPASIAPSSKTDLIIANQLLLSI